VKSKVFLTSDFLQGFQNLVGISKRQAYLQGFENLVGGNKTFENSTSQQLNLD
jgi:hypothetical protein